MSVEALFESISLRWRPEDVVKTILNFRPKDFDRAETVRLTSAVPKWAWSSMSTSFDGAKDLTKQLKTASELFKIKAPKSSDPVAVAKYIERLKNKLDATPSPLDFKKDRLDRDEREKVRGMPKGHRAYNKRFRLLQRLDKKFGTWRGVAEIRSLAQIAKSRLASEIEEEDFSSDVETACFIAYLTARMNMRSVFTFDKQDRPYDEIAELFFKRLGKKANWFAIAHVYPQPEVLAKLTERQKGRLLGTWFSVMTRAAKILQKVAKADKPDLRTLIVQRGNDSSTWNEAAGAFNKAREGWINTLYALGAESVLDSFAPGKALRLMAADVAWGHRTYGDGLEPDTAVWGELPKPWDVMLSDVGCNRQKIEDACEKFGIKGKGWIAPREKSIAEFKPTPELVYGVQVGSPAMAVVFKKLGYFAGPSKARHAAPAPAKTKPTKRKKKKSNRTEARQ
jgi:hypothetical protein